MIWRALAGTCHLCLLPLIVTAQYTPTPRWGQAAAQLGSTLYVHGGLSDPFNSFSYTSAPEISDLLLLDLSTSFNALSPPWQLLSLQSSPAVAWHTLSAFNTTHLLFFGGQPGADSQTVLTTLNDSAALLSASNLTGPSFLVEPQNWAGEPMRRTHHSASSTGGKTWIIGGEKADGSGNAFDEHYLFSSSDAEFSLLPSSSNAPPDIYGHASLVLADGRLVVIGGYCASCSGLVPMDMVWFLDTTQSTVVWGQLSVSSASLPSSRRDFAAVVLADGNILIHGGGDMQLQVTYDDGWILDTSQNPMVWHNVEALAQLGQRKDHFAVQAGGYVLFCFGYGASSPASASLFIYDPTTSSMVSSYIAPSLSPTSTLGSLSLPTQTGSSDSGGNISAGGPSGSRPSDTSGAGSGSDDHTTAIALGTTFGILGLVAGGLAATYYITRVRGRDKEGARRFFQLGADTEVASAEEESGVGSTLVTGLTEGHVSEHGRGWVGPAAIVDILAHLNITKSGLRSSQPRKDMFADEDTRSFGGGGRLGTLRREDSKGTSSWSLRSVSALVRGIVSRDPSESGAGEAWDEWEKIGRFHGDQEGLIRQEESDHYSRHSLDPTHGRNGSLWSYTDPFENPQSEDEYDDLDLRLGDKGADDDDDRSISNGHDLDNSDRTSFRPLYAALSLSVPSRVLHPLKEASHTSLSDPSHSLSETSQEQSAHAHSDNSIFLSRPTDILHATYGPTARHSSCTPSVASPARYSSILNDVPPPSQPIRRSDSWWLRFAKTPLLDRRTSLTSHKPLDFRDPRPAPPLLHTEDTNTTSSIFSASQDIPIGHDRSVSSAHSSRTANTESAERLGGSFDVVQRRRSDGSTSRRTPSVGSVQTIEHGLLAIDPPQPSNASIAEKSLSLDSLPTTSSQTLLPSWSSDVCSEIPSPSDPTTPPEPIPMSPKKGVVVSSSIKAYERRMSQESHPLLSPLKDTNKREEIPSRSRPTVQYGLAPHASLFIANPDSKHPP
ncbi:hypothetical protein PAXRUDRAFT_130893 [Paxillus rubicundulus Ve08.2h10]|uniref:Galactose oxidase n=1 Tax=Paxillus rubicundulus Ve08.2h10 TaxID=930991 RepID=A0A0D0DML6_9AGAM|nr:hypothetical protein PAXRUDRAFT_130893 [Paxillus rubicundulus Ve08.2h10]